MYYNVLAITVVFVLVAKMTKLSDYIVLRNWKGCVTGRKGM
jgi:hypothetical protein